MRYNKKNKRIEWKKPVVKTYGDAVDVIKGVCDGKDIDAADNCFSGSTPIGTA